MVATSARPWAAARGPAPTRPRARWLVGTVARVAAAWLAAAPAGAVVLPEDRSDLLYHYYDGGGVEVRGPAVLVRKGYDNKASFSAGYYADSISSASIDVLTNASPYKDKRDEYRFGVDYLYGNSLMNFAYVKSEENDYLADTYSLSVSHEMFGGQTTASMGYTLGRDVVQKAGTTFEDSVDRHQYRLGLSQVLTKSLIMNLDYEAITDDGFLSNPYRSARILGASVPERYPRTRTSHALSARMLQGLDLFGTDARKSALRADYRYFWDTWDIAAHTVELGYRQYFGRRWLFDWHYRYYDQTKAAFYSDNFDTEFIYMARDKELSTFNSHSFGGKVSYRFVEHRGVLDKASINLAYDRIAFSYDDFTDTRTGQLYSFDANVIQVFLSLWY